MGGDRAPEVVVEGAVAAARRFGVQVILVGDQDAVHAELAKHDPPPNAIQVVHASQVAGMDETPTDVLRKKRDSSIRVAFDLVKSGRAQAAVSAGNSGATLAVGTVVLGRLDGVERPGIAGVFPTLTGRTVVIDIGANVDSKPNYLYQFGLMGEAYAQVVLGVPQPRVGILSIGEEDSKGNELVKKAHDLFRTGTLNFIGNVEGRDVFAGHADVIVCDGFVGNVVLKLAEGLASAMGVMLKKELNADWRSRLGGLLAAPAFQRFKARMDYAEFGGAPLLGLRGVGIISHGASSAKAMMNAIRVAGELAAGDVPGRLALALGHRPASVPANTKNRPG
jgi:glycerol-3-phosphate acyltransferase PlsX